MQKIRQITLYILTLIITFTFDQYGAETPNKYSILCDGKIITVSKKFALSCQTLKNYLDLCSDAKDEFFPIPQKTGIKPKSIKTLISLTQKKGISVLLRKLHRHELKDILVAADYLDIRGKVQDQIIEHCDKKLKTFKSKWGFSRFVKILPTPTLFEAVALHDQDLTYARTEALFESMSLMQPSAPQALNLLSLANRSCKAKWSPDGTKIAISNLSGITGIQVFDASDGRLLSNLNTWAKETKWANKNTVVIVRNNHDVTIWNLLNEDKIVIPYPNLFTCVKPSKDGSRLAIKKYNENLVVHNIVDGSIVLTINSTDNFISIKWSPDDTKIFAVGAEELKIFDAATGAFLAKLEIDESWRAFKSAKWIGNNKIATSQYQSQPVTSTVSIWDVNTGKKLHTFENASEIAQASKDGALLLLTNYDGAILICNPDGKTIKKITTPDDVNILTSKIKLSPDKISILSANNKGVVAWDRKSGKVLQQMSSQEHSNVSWNPATKGFLAVSSDKNITIWTAKKPVEVCKEYENMIAEEDSRKDKRRRLA